MEAQTTAEKEAHECVENGLATKDCHCAEFVLALDRLARRDAENERLREALGAVRCPLCGQSYSEEPGGPGKGCVEPAHVSNYITLMYNEGIRQVGKHSGVLA